jgi:hypothetical protein
MKPASYIKSSLILFVTGWVMTIGSNIIYASNANLRNKKQYTPSSVKISKKKAPVRAGNKIQKKQKVQATPPLSKGLIDTQIKEITKQAPTLNPNVLALSLKAYHKFQANKPNQRPFITIIDYSKPSSEPRLWVLNLKNNKVVLHHYVGHGKNSGPNRPNKFSNRKESFQSSIGVLKTADAYFGNYGYALRVVGLEKGFNDNIAARNIVFHASRYANENFIRLHGRLGRSKGCFSVNPNIIKTLVDTIRGGTMVFSYYPDPKWLSTSDYLT